MEYDVLRNWYFEHDILEFINGQWMEIPKKTIIGEQDILLAENIIFRGSLLH